MFATTTQLSESQTATVWVIATIVLVYPLLLVCVAILGVLQRKPEGSHPLAGGEGDEA
jgi:hypothetical protein